MLSPCACMRRSASQSSEANGSKGKEPTAQKTCGGGGTNRGEAPIGLWQGWHDEEMYVHTNVPLSLWGRLRPG